MTERSYFIDPRRWRSVYVTDNEFMTAVYLRAIMRNHLGCIHAGPVWALQPRKGVVAITLKNGGAELVLLDEAPANPAVTVSMSARQVEARVAEGRWDQAGQMLHDMLKRKGVPVVRDQWPCCATTGTLVVYFDEEFLDYVYEWHAPEEDDDEI